MKRKDLVEHLNTFLEIEKFSDYCPNGLQVEGKEEVQKVATAVSANLLTIEAAIEAKVDMLIVHHGMFWVNDPFPIIGAKRKKLELLFEAGISLCGYHLPLDAHQVVGNNWKAAEGLEMGVLRPFDEIGVEGEIKPTAIEKFVEKVEAFYGHKAHAACFGKKEIKTVALVSGGAWRRFTATEADCFITGSFDEPVWGWAQEEGRHFLALGHSATEKIGPKALAAHIEKEFQLPSSFLDIENPF